MNTAIIWAIDPFETETLPDSTALKSFVLWSKSLGIPILPVHVLSFSTAYEMANFRLKDATHTISSAEKAARNYISGLHINGVLPPKIELTASYGRKKEIQKLLAVAEIHNAPVIAVSSHGRSGLDRLALGSFAENLLAESRRPILFLNRASERPLTIRKVLFPTDFSQRSESAFRQFLPHAKALNAELLLFHATTFRGYAIAPGGLYGAGYVGIPQGYFKNLALWSAETGARWIELAQASGVSARMLTDDQEVTSRIAPAILEHARKEQVQLIAMASLSGTLGSLLAGSISREVFRTREYPVWVWGPKATKTRSTTERAPLEAQAL